MNNIFARSGIEFLAVLLGLSGSLWIDNIVKENEHKQQNKKILTRLYSNLIADSSDGVWNKEPTSMSKPVSTRALATTF